MSAPAKRSQFLSPRSAIAPFRDIEPFSSAIKSCYHLKAVSGSKKFVRHAEQQGLTPHRLEVEELFGEKVRGGEFLS